MQSPETAKVVYLSGPYRSDSEHGVYCNIEAASALALQVWGLGAACICPHKNTAYFGGSLPDHVWLDGDLELLRRSDAVLMVPGWEKSQGANAEYDLAIELRLPVFEDLDAMARWLAEWRAVAT